MAPDAEPTGGLTGHVETEVRTLHSKMDRQIGAGEAERGAATAAATQSLDSAVVTGPVRGPARRTHVLYVRVTAEEKRRIVVRAQRTGLSLSRYLVRLALDGRAPPSAEERRRLEELLLLFQRTVRGVGHLRTEAESLRLFAMLPGIADDFLVAEETLTALVRELQKRL